MLLFHSLGASVENRNTEETFVVEKVLDSRLRGHRKEYLLKWKGYLYSQSTWEPEENLDCPDLISRYEEKKKKRVRKAGENQQTFYDSLVPTNGCIIRLLEARHMETNAQIFDLLNTLWPLYYHKSNPDLKVQLYALIEKYLRFNIPSKGKEEFMAGKFKPCPKFNKRNVVIKEKIESKNSAAVVREPRSRREKCAPKVMSEYVTHVTPPSDGSKEKVIKQPRLRGLYNYIRLGDQVLNGSLIIG